MMWKASVKAIWERAQGTGSMAKTTLVTASVSMGSLIQSWPTTRGRLLILMTYWCFGAVEGRVLRGSVGSTRPGLEMLSRWWALVVRR